MASEMYEVVDKGIEINMQYKERKRKRGKK